MAMSYDDAALALKDPNLDPAVLAQIAYEHEELRTHVVLHPRVYLGLLEWLDTHGDGAVRLGIKLQRKRLNLDS